MAFCLVIAVPAWLLGKQFEMVGGPVFAILIGMVLALVLKGDAVGSFGPGVKYTSKKVLQYAVILLGFGLNLAQIAQVGATSLPIIVSTIATSLVIAFALCRIMGIDGKISTLVGVGSSICGGSAIAATAPVIDADDEEIARAISVIFLFNIVAALIFPTLGGLLGLSNEGFGLFAGTAVNNTSSVTAAAAAWDDMHPGANTLDAATIVKLTRTLSIIPITLALVFWQVCKAKRAAAAGVVGEGAGTFDLKRIFPFFILFFVLASVITTVFALPAAVTAPIKELSKFFIVMAMAAIGFNTNVVAPLIRFINRLAQVCIAVVGGGMLVAGQMSIGVFQAFFHYIYQVSEPLTQLSLTVNTLQNALASVERVFDILDEPEVEPDPASGAAAHSPAAVEGAVAFEHVRFGYDPAHPLMRDVSFRVRPGQKVAVVGATGAGKTTLINLLMRFYEVDGGRITLDGADTRAMARADLRGDFGMVLQDAWLFDGTIAENIAYGKPDATRDEIVEAAKMARVDFFVRTMPQGYDTRVENDAENISQGQRQLLTIARVILRDPKILILDEATSSVDTRTEQEIARAMETLMHGRTSFVIAHRLSTIVDADLILHMRAGTIIEQGTHEELLAANGPYAELYRSQFA